MKSAMKFEMMYQARMLSSEIVMKAMNDNETSLKPFDKMAFLKTLKHCRFEAGYYDKDKKPLYTEIDDVRRFDTDFFIEDKKCFTVTEDKSEHLGIRYIVLKENDLSSHGAEVTYKNHRVFSLIFYFNGDSRVFFRPTFFETCKRTDRITGQIYLRYNT